MRREWRVSYTATLKGYVIVEAESADEAKRLVTSGEDAPDAAAELTDLEITSCKEVRG